MTARAVVLKLHLWLGAAASILLVILGLTGGVIAFENDIDHWLHPDLFYVQVRPHTISEADLIATVERRFVPDRVAYLHIFREKNLVHQMQLAAGRTVFADPYDGRILGSRTTAPATEVWLGYIHQLHTHLVPDPRRAREAGRIGGIVVQIAGFALCLLAPSGLILWWRLKRASIKWRASWFRICFDAHNAVGIYAALFLFVAGVTGVLVGQDKLIFRVTHSPGPSRFPQLHSAAANGARAISVDRAEEIARRALPGAAVTDIMLPRNSQDLFVVALRVPEETSEFVHSYAFIDQYSGKVLHLSNFLTDSFGYRVIRFNRSIHTGDVFGTAGHVIMSISSLLVVVMAATGVVIWLKKLAI